MSGIEVVGLVLGAIPLLISAVEHYRESAEVLEDWWKFRRKYQKCKRDLEYLQLGFSANLEELLLPLICDDDQIDALMSFPGGPAWHDTDLQERLQARLSTAYDLYVNSMVDIQDVMHKLTRELGLEKMAAEIQRGEMPTEASISGSAKSVYIQFTQRTKFALGQSNREKYFEEFTKYNDRLRDLLRTSDRLGNIKANRTTKDKSVVKLTSMLWKRATTLYKLLYSAWSCPCQSSHRANLRLQDRRTEESLSSFDITFLYSAPSDTHGRPWSCCRTSIVVVEEPIASPKDFHVSSPLQSPLGLSQFPSPLMPLSPKSTQQSLGSESSSSKTSFFGKIKSKKTIAFASKDTQICYSGTTTLVSSEVSLALGAENGEKKNTKLEAELQKEIDDLCQTLQGTDNAVQPDCFGVLKADNEHYQIFPQANSSKEPSADSFSLKEVLEQKTDVKLTRRQRYGLASALASSEVQLNSTPWLNSDWNKSQILFFKSEPKSTTEMIDKPRLAMDFKDSVSEDTTAANSNRDLKSLGILLLELCFGCSLENTDVRQKYPVLPGPQNVYLDIAAALELCEHVIEEAGPEYASAVEWCLKKNQSATATDVEWRTELYENVVKPLQQCHGHLVG